MTREEYEEQDRATWAMRLRAAVVALRACDLSPAADRVDMCGGGEFEAYMRAARSDAQRVRKSLQDGSDPRRYALCNAALTALGALWAVS